MAPPVSRIYAVRYAHRATTSSEVFYRDLHQAPLAMDSCGWALTDGTRTVVGLSLALAEARAARRAGARLPAASERAAGRP
jgi:hypothetical protein